MRPGFFVPRPAAASATIAAMQPAFKITVNGSDLTPKIADRFLQLAITDEAGVSSDRFELKIDDRDQRLSIPPTRATVTIEIGYQGSKLINKGTFVIEDIELSGPLRTMVIRGTSVGASRGAGASREASWHDTTLGKVANSIAQRHGWKLSISKDLAAIEIEHEDQRENDLQFLSRLAAENDAVAKVSQGHLVINPHASGNRVSGGNIPSVVIRADDSTDWSMTLAERGNYAGVKAGYHDLKSGERGEIIEGEDTDNTTTLPHVYKSKSAAKSASKARRNSLKRNRNTFTIYNMPGDPSMRSEVTVKAEGFRAGVDGDWMAIRVMHRLTDSGYICAVECATPQAKAQAAEDKDDSDNDNDMEVE